MDSTLNEFFTEINKITPAKEKQKKTECVWRECFDESSGYAYYWNTETDEVTWEMPDAYRLWKDNASKSTLNLFIPPQTSSFLPNTNVQNNLKIYKISECKGPFVQSKKQSLDESNNFDCNKKKLENEKNKAYFESKKVVLVPSYKLESDSEDDCSSNSKSPPSEEGINIEEGCGSNKTDDDILNEEPKNSRILKKLGNEVHDKQKKNQDVYCDDLKKKKEMEGFSLVAGYGNSDEDDKTAEPIISENENDQDTGSLLFPINKTVNSRQFIESRRKDLQEIRLKTENMLYQRKKRINLEYSTTKSTAIPTGSGQYAGFGYDNSHQGLPDVKKKYMGFKSGGILFANSDISSDGDNSMMHDEEENDELKMRQEIEETSQTLSEKLKFLGEGREPTSAVQTLYIQIETLNAALKANSLNPKYLSDWLQNTCSELVKLEQSAAPVGWSLQWDRPNKRYFYYNQKTGENQWEYPQQNAIRSDESMDICMTPPPPSEEASDEQPPLSTRIPFATMPVVPPPPPSISKVNSPSPPPPPHISQCEKANNEITDNKEMSKSMVEPLPPGVDFSEIAKSTRPHSDDQQTKTPDVLGQELDSFYSDIAALEERENTSEISLSQVSGLCETDGTGEVPKRKKKKVKIAEGLSLRKKGVSELVEKWKNVQKDLNSSN